MGKVKLLTFALVALALLLAGCEREINDNVENNDEFSAVNCFTCHAGYLDAAQGEWANSVHASGDNVDYTNRGGGSDCTRCHDEQGFIYFLANGEPTPTAFENPAAIGCFTCHNPHENGNMDLRTDAAFTLLNGDVFDHGAGNLCANCHHSRVDASSISDGISVSTHWGPHHGPQADMINGSNGWEFPGEGYSFGSSPHRTAVPNVCVHCHMASENIHDGYKVGGHSWNMMDEETGSNLVAMCQECHEDAESYDVDSAQTHIEVLLEDLGSELQSAGLFDATNHPISGPVADANLAGAMYNFLMVEEDRSEGVHNYDYARDLLEASIDYVQNNPPAPTASKPVTVVPSH
jgi:hypothetical protein